MTPKTVKIDDSVVFRAEIKAALRRAIAAGNGKLAKALAATLLRHPVTTEASA